MESETVFFKHHQVITSLLDDERFQFYVKDSLAQFKRSTSHYSSTIDELPFKPSNGVFVFPFSRYSRVFFNIVCELSQPNRLSDINNTIPFYDLLAPVSAAIGFHFFKRYKHYPIYRSYLKCATEELAQDLSNCLCHILFELFSESLSFGTRINRFYQQLSDSRLLPRSQYYNFVRLTFDNNFIELLNRYPMSVYYIGQSLFYWHHRHIELLSRLDRSLHRINEIPLVNLSSLSFSPLNCGDNHNFNRRSYTLTYHQGDTLSGRICYKPRSVANDLYFFNLLNTLNEVNDLQLRLPRCYNFGDFGFTEFIASEPITESDVRQSQFNDGIWLFLLWVFGFIDCTCENFVFNRNQHTLVDFETAFTGFFRLSSKTSALLSTRELLNFSCTRTTLLPRWDLIIDDRFSTDVSCLGDYLFERTNSFTPWIHTNTDYMLYEESCNKMFNAESVPLGNPLLSNINNDIHENIIMGFNYAYNHLFELINQKMQDISSSLSLYSRFIFRDTVSYSLFLFELYSPISMSSTTTYFKSLDKLDRLAIDHPSSSFVEWITNYEKIQLFNQDIPYFLTDINARSLDCVFGQYLDFSKIFYSGYEFITKLVKYRALIELQPFLIETSLKSQISSTEYHIEHSPILATRPFSTDLFDSLSSLVRFLIAKSLLNSPLLDSSFCFALQSGITRKNVQINTIDYSFFNGYLGILFAEMLITSDENSCCEDQYNRLFQALEHSFYVYSPSFSGTQSYGLSQGPGFIYGLNLLSSISSSFDPTKFIDKKIFLQVYDNSASIISSDVSPDLFSGLSGNLIALLSQQPSVDDLTLNQLIDNLLMYQCADGIFLSSSIHSNGKKITYGIAHGIHGILLALLHTYHYTGYQRVLDSINHLVKAYDLLNCSLIASFNSNLSWCSGLSGHLVTISYLKQIIPTYDIEDLIIDEALDLIQKQNTFTDLHFCCGMSGVVASLMYLKNHSGVRYTKIISAHINRLNHQLLSYYKDSLNFTDYIFYQPSLLDGFSVLSLLSTYDEGSSDYLESIVIFKAPIKKAP